MSHIINQIVLLRDSAGRVYRSIDGGIKFEKIDMIKEAIGIVQLHPTFTDIVSSRILLFYHLIALTTTRRTLSALRKLRITLQIWVRPSRPSLSQLLLVLTITSLYPAIPRTSLTFCLMVLKTVIASCQDATIRSAFSDFC
jgi:hypothetical protein